MPSLNMGIIKSLKMPVPPTTAQDIFVRKMEKVQNALDIEGQGLESIEILFSSLQQRAFKGEL